MNRSLAFLLVLLLAMATGFVHADPQKKPGKAKVGTLKKKLGNVRTKKKTIQRQLRQTRAAASDVRLDIHRVDDRIGRLESQLEETEHALSLEKDRQAKGASLLAQSRKDLAVVSKQVAARLKDIYMSGNRGVISVLAGAKSTSDLMMRKELMESVAHKDRELFERCAALTHEVERRKKLQDQTVRNVGRLQSRQLASRGTLAVVREEKRVALVGLKKQHAVLEASLKEFQDDENEIAGEIASYMRRYNAARPRPGVPHSAGFFGRPCNGRITSGFGMRYHPILHIVRMHTGVDFGAPVGTPIYSVAEGVVVATGYGSGYGNRVIIDHGGGILTLYGHCSKIYVGSGQHVTRGQNIAAVGNSGLSTGPHLHFEVWQNGRKVNPMSRL
ncbi:peptidoglycan DD-metalloendopeptidase family protein [soil metagenome]